MFLACAALLAAGCASGNSAPGTSSALASGPPTTIGIHDDIQRLNFTTKDGTSVDYVLVVPPGRAAGQPGKVLLTFPPGGQDLSLTERIVDQKFRQEAIARGWVVVSPAAPSTGLFYTDASARLVPELLDKIAHDYPPEGDRFDLAGVSNGGLSAFKAALAYPDRFRSLVVFPGYSPDGGNDPNLARLRNIGVSMFVGGDDAGWLEPSEQTRTKLTGLGYRVELHVVPGEGHIIQSLTGTELFDAIERVRE